MIDDHEAEAARAALSQAVEQQTDDALAAWAETGLTGLRVLREVLRGTYRPSWPGVHPRDAIDGIAAAVSAIAVKHAAAFLGTFTDPEFEKNVEVLIGLGWIDDPEATRRLLGAMDADDSWVRMQAVIGLGRRRSPEAEAALTRAINDTEYLVRYHALKGLAATGRPHALPALRSFQGQSDYERQLAASAIDQIERRAGFRE